MARPPPIVAVHLGRSEPRPRTVRISARSRCSVRDFARMWRSRSGRRDPGGAGSFGGERRCVEFPRGNSISLPRLPRAGKGSMTLPRPTVAWPSKRRLSDAELEVRIHSPPGESQMRTSLILCERTSSASAPSRSYAVATKRRSPASSVRTTSSTTRLKTACIRPISA